MVDSGNQRIRARSGSAQYAALDLRTLKLEDPLAAEDIDKDLAVYGLAKPEITVGVKAPAGEKSLLLGKLNQYVSKRYVKEASTPAIYMSSNELFTAADKPAEGWITHRSCCTIQSLA